MRRHRKPGAFRRTAGRLAGADDGQALVFGAMTLFMLAAFVIFIGDMGLVTSGKIHVQNAADECAYSGALYEANIISAVAYLNEAMAYMYYDALRYAVDTTSIGVLASLKQWGPKYPSDKIVYDDKDSDAPDLSGSPIANYDRVYRRAQQNVPEIERTLAMFARWEWGMALSCAELVRMEINRVALKNGIDGLALYPDVDFFPDNGVQFDLHILKLMEGGQHVGWRVWSEDPDFFVEARKLGPYHWLITNTDRVTYEIERVGLNPDTYRIQTPDKDITVTIHEENEHIGLVIIDHSGGDTNETRVDARRLPGLGWAISAEDKDTRVDYEPFSQGGWKIKVTNKKTGRVDEVGVRMNNGRLQEWTGGGWADVPGQRDSVTVGGVKVNVQISSNIDLGNGTFFDPGSNTLHVGDVTYHIPNVFDMGNIWVSLGRDSVQIDALIGIATRAGRKTLRFRIEEESREMIIYGLLGIRYRVPGSADCKWHANADGSQRDRLCRDCQLLEGECTTPESEETEWTYQYRMGHPYFIKEDLRRFAHHAICDRDEYARNNNFQYPQWTEWYDIANGAPFGREYFQTRPKWDAPANYDSDGDGRNDSVRVYASDTWGLNRDDNRTFDRHYRMVKPWNIRDIAGVSMRFAPPLRLSEDFFYHAFTVGCWRMKRGDKESPFSLFRDPNWGYLGVAAARCGFLERESDDPADEVPQYRFTWPNQDDVVTFVNAGYENLYEPVWTVHLWPLTDAIRSEHLDAYVPNQTGLSYLMHGLLRTHWYRPRPPEEIGSVRERVFPDFRGLHINFDHPQMNEVMEH